jgi:hypothetical protein
MPTCSIDSRVLDMHEPLLCEENPHCSQTPMAYLAGIILDTLPETEVSECMHKLFTTYSKHLSVTLYTLWEVNAYTN